MTTVRRAGLAVLGALLAGAGMLAVPAYAQEDFCMGVDTDLTEAGEQIYARLIADAISADQEPSEDRLQPSDVEIYDLLEVGDWSAVYGAVPTADVAMFFFEEVNGDLQFRDVWGGMAEPSERDELTGWAKALGAPEALARCFAHVVADEPSEQGVFSFDVELAFTPDALETLSRRAEEVVVSASYYADPTPESEEHADEVGRIDLGTEDVQGPAEPGVVEITGSHVDTDALQWTRGDILVNVNVFTARLSAPDNLISCDFIDGPLESLPSTPVVLRCALIEEDRETEVRP